MAPLGIELGIQHWAQTLCLGTVKVLLQWPGATWYLPSLLGIWQVFMNAHTLCWSRMFWCTFLVNCCKSWACIRLLHELLQCLDRTVFEHVYMATHTTDLTMQWVFQCNTSPGYNPSLPAEVAIARILAWPLTQLPGNILTLLNRGLPGYTSLCEVFPIMHWVNSEPLFLLPVLYGFFFASLLAFSCFTVWY